MPLWAAAVVGTAVWVAGTAQADPGTPPSDPGIGPISTTIEQVGQSLCPSLVKPGSDLAAKLSELQGNTGLTPALTGLLAGLAIQTQCPAVMTKIANGNLDLPVQPLPGLSLPGLTPPGQPVPGHR